MANSCQILNAIRIVQCKEKISSKVSPTFSYFLSFWCVEVDTIIGPTLSESFEVVILLLIANKCDAIAKLSSSWSSSDKETAKEKS